MFKYLFHKNSLQITAIGLHIDVPKIVFYPEFSSEIQSLW